MSATTFMQRSFDYKRFFDISFYKNKDVQKSLFVTVASILNGFFAYLLQIFLGRSLTVGDYGTFNAFMSLFSLLTFFNAAISTAVIKVVSEQQDKKMLTALFWDLSLKFFGVGALLFLVLALFKNQLSDFLNISEPVLFIFFGLYLFSKYFSLPLNSFLQGLLEFNLYSLALILSGFFRAALAIAAAYLGFAVIGVFIGISTAEFLVVILVFLLLKKHFINSEKKYELSLYEKRIIQLSLPVFTTYFGMMFFFNIDILMVKKFFDANTTGLYVGAATVGKLLLFGASSVSFIMLPQISSLRARSENYLSRFNTFALVQTAIALIGLIIFLIFPKFITLLFFGKNFLGSVKLVPLYALFISIYVMINFMTRYFIAIDRVKVTNILLIGFSFLQFVLLAIFHGTLEAVLSVNLIVVTGLFLSLVYYHFRVHAA